MIRLNFKVLIVLTGISSSPGFVRAGGLDNSSSHGAAFIENKGQVIDQHKKPNFGVLFLLNTPGINVQLRKDGFSYDVYQAGCIDSSASDQNVLFYSHDDIDDSSLNKHKVKSFFFHRIDIDLKDCNRNCRILRVDTLPDYYNYFTAGCPPDGIKRVRQFKKIIYQDVYPGIDLEFFTGQKHGFKYNFVIHPGADINNIRLMIRGPDSLSIRDGRLFFDTRFGKIEEAIPESYCMANGTTKNINVCFRRMGNDIFGFSPDSPIPERSTVIIDPTAIRLWGTYYGGWGLDAGLSCSSDQNGYVFLSGNTQSSINIATSGSFQSTLSNAESCFLTKFDASGLRIWGTYFGGNNYEVGGYCTAYAGRDIYLTGYTQSDTGIATSGAHQTVYGGGQYDCFLAKFDQAGDRLWATYYGGASLDETRSISHDIFGNVFLAGNSDSDTGISTPDSYQPMHLGKDAMLAKFDSNGTLLWGTFFGGEGDDHAHACANDLSGNIYLSGETQSITNIATPGAFKTTFGGAGDAFLAKFTSGGQRIWSTYYGGSGNDKAFGCATDSKNNVVVTGQTKSPDSIATPGCFQPVYGGGLEDAFVVKFNIGGQRLWGTYYGGALQDDSYGCAIGQDDDIFVFGDTWSDNNISTAGSYQPSIGSITCSDAMIIKLDSNGIRLWGSYYGGDSYDGFYGCNYVAEDTIYIVGHALSVNKIATPGSCQDTYFDMGDAMLIKFLDCWPIDTAGPISGPSVVCKPATINYSVPLLAHSVNYIWTLPPGFTISGGSGSSSITVTAGATAASGIISVKGMNKCNDPGDSAMLFVTVGTAPLPVVSGPLATCAGPGKVYTTASGKSNYQWSVSPGGLITSGGGASSNTLTVTWNSAGNMHVYLNYTDTNGCSAPNPTDFPVQVLPSPSATIFITSSNNVCSGTPVTFHSASSNGGAIPSWNWQVNGINRGTNDSVFTYTPLNNDQVMCIFTSSLTGCIMNNPDTSNVITMIVTPGLPVGITVSPSQNPVCQGTSVTFTAQPTNPGPNPVYQWHLNGNPAGTGGLTYTFTPNNGDMVSCTLTSNATCTTNNPASSIEHQVSVNPILPVSVTITSWSNPFCAGGPVTFSATPANPGITPHYQWKVNGMIVGADSIKYTYNPANGDQVSCVMNSSIPCPLSNPVTSNTITMTENNNLPAGVSITASQNPFCPATTVTFTATPTYGGPGPAYQWKVNGNNAGVNSNTYSYNPIDGDIITCIMTSNEPCVTNNPASSLPYPVSVSPAPVVTFTPCFDTITTTNAKPIKLKGGVPPGGTYSGVGVNSATEVFTPSIAGAGTHSITYTYTNIASCVSSKAATVVTNNALPFVCGNVLSDPRDNHVYHTVKIGGQCWMAEDLNYGIEIQSARSQRDNCINERYRNPISGIQNPASVYQWDELMKYDDTPAIQGLCPPAWHVPTESDWNVLFLVYSGSEFAAASLKYSGFSGFTAILSGVNHENRQWDYTSFAGFYWSSDRNGPYKAWAHGMNQEDPSISRYPALRSEGFSVRCVKD